MSFIMIEKGVIVMVQKSVSILLLIVLLLMATLSFPEVVRAESDGVDYVKVGLVAVAVGVVTFAVRYFVKNSQAREYYERGERYAALNQWDLAADAYAKAAEIRPKYRDVQSRLAHARSMASTMLLELGDKARAQEKFEEAREYYSQALYYKPESTQIKSRLDEISREMVAIFYRRGLTYETQNRWHDAFLEYQKAYFVNPRYQDLENRYQRARSVVEGERDLCVILFFINKTSQSLENPLILALQRELMGARHDIFMLDYISIQGIIQEQAEALGDTLGDPLAMDLGRLLGVTRVITGTIESITTVRGRLVLDLSAKMMAVPSGEVIEEVTLSYRFPSGVEYGHLPHELEEVAKELADGLI